MSKNNPIRILIVDDEADYRNVLKIILSDKGYVTDLASSGEEALLKLDANDYNIVITDLIMESMDGVDLLRIIKDLYPNIMVILMTGYGTIENAVKAMKLGAFTYVIKSHEPEKIVYEVKKAEKKMLEIESTQVALDKIVDTDFMLSTKNEKFKEIIEMAKKAASSNVNILILGESGVGKEVLAKYIHQCSDRKENRFVPVNCSSFSDNLLESELFGHEKGSFTGAFERRIGRFESSNNGTLFLDEIGEISLNTQIKLLRNIETKAVQRIGSNKSINIDFRLISATNRILEKEILANRFREDFFYRISTITIRIPPLRERREDLKMFIDYFLKKSEIEMSKRILDMEDGVMDFLMNHNYSGNIRELKNIIARLVVLSENGIIRKQDLPAKRKDHLSFFESKDILNTGNLVNVTDTYDIKPIKDVKKEVEEEYIMKVLALCDNNVSEAARKMSISRRQLFKKIAEYKLRD